MIFSLTFILYNINIILILLTGDRGGKGAVFIYLPCWLFSLLSFCHFFLFTQNKGSLGPPLDPPMAMFFTQVGSEIKKIQVILYEGHPGYEPEIRN